MNNHEASTHYCDTYGFNADWRQARLTLLNLTAIDAALGDALRTTVLAPNAAAIIEAFYSKLLTDPEARQILDAANLAGLKQTLTAYLLNFGKDFATQAYFEERLHIGLTHAWAGLPLSLYLCAYQILQAEIAGHISRSGGTPEQHRELYAFVSRIAALDASLASEVYHLAQMRYLESSVTRLRDERAQWRHAAGTDALTGLDNRASLLPHLNQLLTVAARTGQPLCVVMADLDHFKAINDSYGHLVGDKVLRDTAARMRSAVRDFDHVGRYGGEEFLAVLQETPLAIAQQIAERVRQRIGEDPFNVIDGGLRVTLSQGIAESRPGDTLESLIARADAALYAAKQAGRDCVRVANAARRD